VLLHRDHAPDHELGELRFLRFVHVGSRLPVRLGRETAT
jgi:hypothetical protein